MPRLLLINGPPGSGKSTVASAMAADVSMTLAVDVDHLKHALTRWDEDPATSGLHARRLCSAMVTEHLAAGYDVIVAQYLARTAYIEELERLAATLGAQFAEVVLGVDTATLAARLRERQLSPSRPEHDVNNRLVGPGDADRLVRSVDALRARRPGAVWVDARGSLAATLDAVRAAVPDR